MPHFLIADDSEAKTMMLEALIGKSGLKAKIIKAKTTETAKQRIGEQKKIDFAFVDYEIPSELGPAIIKALKGENPACRIALVSASDSEEYRTDAMAAGAESYVCTSFGTDDIEKQILGLIEEWTGKNHKPQNPNPKKS